MKLDKAWLFVLGAQKCGTTTLADLINEHPLVYVPPIKETYFFCDEMEYEKGSRWYLEEYYSSRRADAMQVHCDATPFYLASRAAIDRIHTFVQGRRASFIVCLRDPVARAYSAYWHQRRLGNERLLFEEALEVEGERIEKSIANRDRWWRHAYVEIGMYGKHLEYAVERLGKDRVLVLTEEDLASSRRAAERVFSFAGLEVPHFDAASKRSNPAAMPRLKTLQSLVTRENVIKKLARAVVPRELRSAIGNRILELNSRRFTYPPMAQSTRELLEQKFAEDRGRLRGLGLPVPRSWAN
ncbi:MAG: sulfotransferase [Gammaproteobacteria bacterium]